MGRQQHSCLAVVQPVVLVGVNTLRQLPLGLSGNFKLRHQQGEINLNRRAKPSTSASSQATVSPVPTPTSSGPTKPEAATAAGATAAGAAALSEEELPVGTEAEPTEPNNTTSGTPAPNVVVPVENGGSSTAANGEGGAAESAEGGQVVSPEPLEETLKEGLGVVAETAAAETRSDGSEDEEAEETDLDNDR